MRKVIYLVIFLLVPQIFAQGIRQDAEIDLVIDESLAIANFAAFTFADVPGGNTRVFSVRIIPIGKRVVLNGVFYWKKDRNSNYENIYEFWTQPFLSRTLTNLDIGRGDITISESSTFDRSVAEEIFSRGRPTGSYRITLNLFDTERNLLDSDTEELTFTNPTQTITIRSPEANSTQDIGSTILQWNNVIGATSYEILANIRRNEGQSLEEALLQGTPIIDNVDVGSRTVANLRQQFTREPLPGQEVVVRVTAVVPSTSGTERLNSNIVNFYIGSSDSPAQEAIRTRMVSVLSTIFQNQGSGFLEMLRNGEIDLSTLRITDESGKIISFEELERLMNYLQLNPDALINVRFQEQ